MFIIADPTQGDLAAIEEGLAEATESGRFVAVVRDVLTVVTPAEDSEGTPVTIQVWDRPPALDDFGADHEVELDLVVGRRLEVGLVSGPWPRWTASRPATTECGSPGAGSPGSTSSTASTASRTGSCCGREPHRRARP
ncbi:MAG TPA: hypothetical protein VLL08_25830 [Kineosporiaceae bacterium]|nr:hypothetical protein [Kineosporiaceae bacterium]